MKQKSRLIEKVRLDALTDGVFAVAMTLMVIDLKLPEHFHPANADEFFHGLAELQTQFLVYIISFIVLGLRWMSLAKLSRLHETVEDRYVEWSLAHLFLVTCIPFSTIVVGRYGAFAPAIWLYCANTILAALIALRLATLAAPHIGEFDAFDRRIGLTVIIVLSILVFGMSFVQPKRDLDLPAEYFCTGGASLGARQKMIEPLAFFFADDGAVPNNGLPFLVYKGAFVGSDLASAIEKAFRRNDRGHGLWHNGIYPFTHYHSQIHEVLGIAAGKARVRFGGSTGEELEIEAGDVAVLPAGTGHQRLSSTPDLLVIGAYPPDGHYDLCRGTSAEHARALTTIPHVPVPSPDPLFGADGALTRLWR